MNLQDLFHKIFSSPQSTAQAIATVAFISLLVVELVISLRKNLKLFETKDTAVNLALGGLTSFVKVFIKGTTLVFFYWVQSFWKVTDIPNTWWSILILFLLNDLIFYWYHRISHESRFFWAMHVAHHSSEILNTSTAIRGNFLHFFYRFVFWSPLALLGFDPIMIVLVDEISFYYQMYIHTEIIHKMPRWFEFIFNTPAHHRVHHASNAQYIDKNYGAIFIIWDRLFGTFEEEKEKPIYGLTKNPPKRDNLFSIITHELVAIARDVRKAKSLKEVWIYIFGRPNAKM